LSSLSEFAGNAPLRPAQVEEARDPFGPLLALNCRLLIITARTLGRVIYAVERDWLIISGGAHSVSLTEAGRRIVTPANFLNRNDSQAQLARWKWPATAMF
jgi:hypothetical protein